MVGGPLSRCVYKEVGAGRTGNEVHRAAHPTDTPPTDLGFRSSDGKLRRHHCPHRRRRPPPWPTPRARQAKEKRFALAAAESGGVIYASGGFDGSKYLQSAERYDPREGFWVRLPSMNARRGCHAVAVLGEVLYAIGGYDGDSMVSSVEIFDPRLNAWRMGDPMSNPRGYASAVTFDDSLFVLGGLRSNEQILDTVEVYNVNSGWSVPDFNSVGKRSFASAIVM